MGFDLILISMENNNINFEPFKAKEDKDPNKVSFQKIYSYFKNR